MAYVQEEWIPLTGLGRMVAAGEITSIDEVLASGRPIKEPQIVDLLLPDLEDEVLDINMVQRMTDSGRRVKFRTVVVVGNRNGYVGFGQGKDVQVGNAIQKAIVNAKLNLIKVSRGCGSWECGCDTGHSIPIEVTGKAGSVRVTLKPAPQGIGLVTGETPKKVLTLAGIKDVWAFNRGQTRTTINYAKATFEALKQTNFVRIGGTE
ncbi:MAG: 30S ribosomal protein S5 [Methanoculleus marisnigri]|jgi:ribosomal protein S5(archaeal type)/S2(eukaryote cytosolic type)|uniref:Small ribosomal subunit protein uS5 n=1 Tax=Methanoculleus marisnigri TaxID=2198 RepID=A0A101J2A1_9EURY|nr:30S ribosomal protein S5 [Methanoculleus marisnigri]KUK63906.1 MAG: 30S ribosomal protein S5 [Methanoculleus marisnigri]KUL05705.1 MAG: 30S ribosomal protein S5 [Methanoculleus marisnigri]